MSIYLPALEGETVVGEGKFTTAVGYAAIAAGNVVVKAAPGRLCSILVTSTTTASEAITIYDNATTASGTIVAIVPGSTAAGTVLTFLMPCQNGITVGSNASLAAGGITISWV